MLVRVGGSLPIATDARVIAATNQSLARMVGEKRFREDLYFRLNVVTLEIRPCAAAGGHRSLRHFLGEFCRRVHRPTPEFSPAALHAAPGPPWPGNVRELRA